MKKSKLITSLLILTISLSTLIGCSQNTVASTSKSIDSVKTVQSSDAEIKTTSTDVQASDNTVIINLNDIPAFTDKAYITINNNIPYFSDADYSTTSFEKYSDLDSLGRCGVAYANIGIDLMPTKDRESIGMVKPSGWQTVKYDNVDGKYLYNRCHLIGYQLTAENANEKNLITGTRYLNIQGMLPFENMAADYIKETKNHVLYRVTPIYDGNNLVVSGVLMEGKSVEDKGQGISFCVYAYNNQPGINIDYSTGKSSLADVVSSEDVKSNSSSAATNTTNVENTTYILNTNSHKFHKPSCSSVSKMSESNKEEFNGTRDQLIEEGYEPCKLCNP